MISDDPNRSLRVYTRKTNGPYPVEKAGQRYRYALPTGQKEIHFPSTYVPYSLIPDGFVTIQNPLPADSEYWPPSTGADDGETILFFA